METVNKEWLDSISLVKQLYGELSPGFGSKIDDYVMGQIKHIFENSFRYGLVTDSQAVLKRMDEYVAKLDEYFARSSEYDKYKKALVEANFQTRRKYFIDYVEMDDEALEQERVRDVEAYKDLIGKLKAYPSEKLGPDYSTITVKDIINEESPEIRSNSTIPFDSAYDIIYTYYQSTYGSHSVLGRTHTDYINYLQGVLDKLNGMTPEDFKNYKIGLLKLSDDEVKRIDAGFSLNNEPIVEPAKEHVEEQVTEEVVPEFAQKVIPDIQKEVVPTFASDMLGKMSAYDIKCPSEFQTSVIDFLSNVCEFNISNPENVVTGVFNQEYDLPPYGKMLSGKVQVWDSEALVSRAVDYYISRNGQESEFYNYTMNLGDSRYSFQYNSLHPERGVSMQVHKHKAINAEPRFGITGIEYEGSILADGSISARGITTEVPSMYDQNGQVRKAVKQKTGDFTCISYEELANITNQTLGLNNEQNPTLK